ncbi:sulfate ABC transporter, inner membrane subunit CysW [Planctopirus limnophila DSM 3776]|uniref:Sulfate ABC transporter, inner membrane subunit CysW n=2 Tax=Planctopirus TaxID=1649480 RepID=D5STG9_PLAL2|nr:MULTISPECIES: sulfate ABC transporter permease subunit CysW [Planctopirus]ADG68998.1 sulfate ABC transporter, inner membrane subunit CysW [Planctopirus limnophila DSM 3776]ODA32051.1 sulfate ABC transporter permease subunit CysW [Planctopirus hydrillae]
MTEPARRGFSRSREPAWLKWLLIGIVYLIVVVLIIVPLLQVFSIALSAGWNAFVQKALVDPDSLHAMWMTFVVSSISVTINIFFGVALAWAVARFQFPGRTLLISMVDLPFAISPVAVGLMFMLLFGRQGFFGSTLEEWGIEIVFSTPGLILATTFVTLPFIARELIPVMEAIGPDEELAAITLGASGWQMFWLVTIPNIRWALLYGVILCTARAMGEFGAVSVLSGKIAGSTETMPLRVDKLFHEHDEPGAFAVASILTLFALMTLIAKAALEHWVLASIKKPDADEL